jgi:hypothetical protein
MVSDLIVAGAALIAGAGILQWIAIIIAVGLLLLSINLFDDRSYGGAGASMIVPTVVLAFFARHQIGDLIAARGLVVAIIELIALYAVIGLAVSFINWIFYCWHVKDRYQEAVVEKFRNDYDSSAKFMIKAFGNLSQTMLDNGEIDTSKPEQYGISAALIKKYIQVRATIDNARTIFDDRGIAEYVKAVADADWKNFKDNASKDDDKGEARLDALLHKMLPPKALHCKRILIAAALEWPVTVLWLLLARVVRTICDRAFWISRGFLDFISKISFGSHDVKVN